jgi:mevalonate kinase
VEWMHKQFDQEDEAYQEYMNLLHEIQEEHLQEILDFEEKMLQAQMNGNISTEPIRTVCPLSHNLGEVSFGREYVCRFCNLNIKVIFYRVYLKPR